MTALRDLIKDPSGAELELVAQYGSFAEDARRERAFKAFATNGLPHRRMEAFKWTDFKAKLKTLEGGKTHRADPFSGLDAHVITVTPKGISGLDNLPAGLRMVTRDDGVAFGASEDVPLGALTAALTKKTIMFDISETPPQAIRLVYQGAGTTMFSRFVFVVRPNVDLSVFESHLGGAAMNASLVRFDVKEGARVERTLVQPAALGEAMAITAEVQIDEGGHYTQTALAFGADVARIETRLVHQQTGTQAVLNGAYLAADGHHIDFTSHVRHGARDCVTKQRTKGAVLNGGTGVFQGKFHVPRNVGQRTDADMQHNALLLEDGAVVNAKPELEIYADDVECAHGNTCGALDAEALFYMRQRGISELQAKAMLTEAFISEALETAPEAARDILLSAAQDWLAL
ncbi:MAG: SufD family Fe-S cluster assembly protein [Hyphomonadaceae bacterium]